MANGQGGYREPANPSPVSGPGALSRRTDGAQPQMQLPDARYGEQQAFQEAQAGAPMAQAQDPGLTPLDAPSQHPGVPVTDGAAMGPGAGPEALGSAAGAEDELLRLHSYLPVLKHLASQPQASQSLRQLVRQLQGASSG